MLERVAYTKAQVFRRGRSQREICVARL